MVCWRYQIAARSLCKPDRRREHSAHLGRIHGTFRRSVGVNVDVRFWRRRTPFDINGLQCKFESLRPANTMLNGLFFNEELPLRGDGPISGPISRRPVGLLNWRVYRHLVQGLMKSFASRRGQPPHIAPSRIDPTIRRNTRQI